MRGPDGIDYPCRATVREVTPPERLVLVGDDAPGPDCGAGIPPRAIVTVTFDEEAGGTRLTLHTRLDSAEARAGILASGFATGWTESLERLSGHLVEVD